MFREGVNSRTSENLLCDSAEDGLLQPLHLGSGQFVVIQFTLEPGK